MLRWVGLWMQMNSRWKIMIRQKVAKGCLGREEAMALREARYDEIARRPTYRRDKPIRDFKQAIWTLLTNTLTPVLDRLGRLAEACGKR